jgi:hypothetical protein
MRRLLAVLTCICSWSIASAAPLLIRFPPATSPQDVRYAYTIDLLHLALDLTGGNYRMEPARLPMDNDRIIRELSTPGGLINVAWIQTTREREQQLLPVRFPIYRGLLGWRLLLIRSEDQPLFDRIDKLDALRRFSVGLQKGWPDVDIMESEHIPVTLSQSYDSLFTMLQKDRFDYMSRSILEIALESEQHKGEGLAIEHGLMLHYSGDLYFFFSPTNHALAERVNAGLLKAWHNGAFAALFQRHWGKIIRAAHVEQRRILPLNNPLFPDTPPEVPFLPLPRH